MIQPLNFRGDALERIKNFPEPAKKITGFELHKVQEGKEPSDWKPMKTVGSGVKELRVAVDGDAFRTIYITKLGDTVYVLHAFQKKTQRTPKKDIDLAQKRLKELERELQKQQKEIKHEKRNRRTKR